MNIKVTVNPQKIDHGAFAALFGKSGWGQKEDYTEERPGVSQESHSIFIIALDENDRLLGYARAMTDYLTVTWIAEVLVDPDYRRQGIGTKLMNEILDRVRHTAIYTEVFVGTESFFEKFGITPQTKLVACSRKPSVHK